jgi:hypothetical protein
VCMVDMVGKAAGLCVDFVYFITSTAGVEGGRGKEGWVNRRGGAARGGCSCNPGSGPGTQVGRAAMVGVAASHRLCQQGGLDPYFGLHWFQEETQTLGGGMDGWPGPSGPDVGTKAWPPG